MSEKGKKVSFVTAGMVILKLATQITPFCIILFINIFKILIEMRLKKLNSLGTRRQGNVKGRVHVTVTMVILIV